MSLEVLPGSVPIPSCFLWSFSLHALYLVGERADRCKMGTGVGAGEEQPQYRAEGVQASPALWSI